ncbi:HK97-gp10 family putative phage morphogenesis protein [uncultured Stenotrophomonas sp.]|uniref:HK97-gp10 family putative phage morphogenesis protein n=1 Tax=uncultured Stenotrophomonas sp. TaxID=165438 RepID=UPI0025DC8404|nr:HK97-gp10 family putative phage morphogenesis protein [uncultured Stenotrophomonas sp.]
MVDFDIHITGLSELESALLALSDKAARRALRKGMRRGAIVVRNDARNRVRIARGKLRRSIRVRERSDDQGWMRFAVEVPRSAFYGKFGEYGTSKMAAWPFMRPAAESKAEEAVGTMRDALGEGIADEMRRARS